MPVDPDYRSTEFTDKANATILAGLEKREFELLREFFKYVPTPSDESYAGVMDLVEPLHEEIMKIQKVIREAPT